MLRVQALHAQQGNTPVLRGVSLCVHPGEIVALLGRNGAGRSTLVQALMGMCPAQGEASWQGDSLMGCATHEIARKGIAYVAEDRAVFPTLTVHQNLVLGLPQHQASHAKRWQFDEVYALFPMLAKRQHTRAAVLSGGEQQMLALGRALMGSPQLMLIDEPTEGLAPLLVERVAHLLGVLRQSGVAVLLVEQNLPLALSLADRVLVMGRGQIVFEGTPQALQNQQNLQKEWLEPW
jgi:branched-chain amino acid transport system ATP-binding protein